MASQGSPTDRGNPGLEDGTPLAFKGRAGTFKGSGSEGFMPKEAVILDFRTPNRQDAGGPLAAKMAELLFLKAKT